jgi:O-methyltransferase
MNSTLRFLFRFSNSKLKKLGLVISKPEIIHGSPAFTGATTFSRKIFIFRKFYEMIEDVEGDVIEAGVHWGYGLLAHLGNIESVKNRRIYAFDSFEGHSRATEKDRSGRAFINLNNSFKISEDDVRSTLLNGTEYNLEEINARIKFVKGWAQETMPIFKESDKIAFVHSDMDIYEPVLCTLKSFWPKMVKGGVIAVGKLNNTELMGKTLAFNEFIATLNKEEFEIRSISVKEINTLEVVEMAYILKK